MNRIRNSITAFTLSFLLSSCSDLHLAESESFIDAFYSFDPVQLEPFFTNAQESSPDITYYQGWAEGGNYKILNRTPCIAVESNKVECSITVEDDPVLALGIEFKVTDTFHISFESGRISAIETSSDDQPIYYAASDWVRANLPDLIGVPCLGFFNGGPTPGDCARAMAQGYAQFAASDDFPGQ